MKKENANVAPTVTLVETAAERAARERVERRRDKLWERSLAIATLIVAALGLGGIVIGINASTQAAESARSSDMASRQSVRESDLRTERADAYADVIDARVRFEMFLWGNLWWAGTADSVAVDEEGLAAAKDQFWSDTMTIQGNLKSTYVRALMVAKGTDVTQTLTAMNTSDESAFSEFKCMSGAVCDPNLPPGTVSNDEIKRLLNDWTEQSKCLNKLLVSQAGAQLQPADGQVDVIGSTNECSP